MRNLRGDTTGDNWAIKREIQAKYNMLSRSYNKVYGDEQRQKYQEVFSNLRKRPRLVCVDIGCGTGIGIEGDYRIFRDTWVGIDLSRGMLEKARRRIHSEERRHLVLADSDFSPLRSKCADLAVCVTLVSGIPDPRRTLRELGRVVVPGGEIAVTILKREITRDEVDELMQETGLRIERVPEDNHTKDHVFLCSPE